jgi:hypothetical protein
MEAEGGRWCPLLADRGNAELEDLAIKPLIEATNTLELTL